MSDEIIVTPNWFNRHQKVLWLSLIVAAFAVAGILTYLLFFRSEDVKPAYEGDAAISVDMPASTASGSEISVRIGVENRSNARLTGLVLEVFYPQDFEFLDSTPDSESEGRGFKLSDLEKGQEREIVVVGRLAGTLAEIKTVSAKLKYIPENFRSTFVAERQASTEITAAPLVLQLLAPTRVITGQSVAYRLRVENVSQQPYPGLRAAFRYPAGFQTSAKGEGEIGTLAAGETKTVEVAGRLTADPGTEALIEAEVASSDGDVLGRSFAFTALDPSPLSLSHSVACGFGSNCSDLRLPAELDYKIQYHNQSQTALKSVALSVAFESALAPYLEISEQSGQRRGNAWVFSPASTRELYTVAPGQKGEFSLRVKVPREALIAKRIKNPELRTRVEYTSKEVAEALSGNTLTFAVGTELAVAAEATSASAGQYQVELSVTNTVNDVSDAQLTAFAAGAASEFSESTVQYDPASGLLTWRLGDVFAFTGAFHEPRVLRFKLSTPDDVLLRDIVVTGKDAFTEREIESNKIPALNAGGY